MPSSIGNNTISLVWFNFFIDFILVPIPNLCFLVMFTKNLFFSFSSSQDMSKSTPTQELVAKDLQGFEWRFKHIFRGKGCEKFSFGSFWFVLLTSGLMFLPLIYFPFYPGQPRRHLLTTGWSTFVTSKRLVAGDTFVFLRYVNLIWFFSLLLVSFTCFSRYLLL